MVNDMTPRAERGRLVRRRIELTGQIEQKENPLLNSCKFIKAEMGDLVADIAGINGANHLAKDAGCFAANIDLRVKTGRAR